MNTFDDISELVQVTHRIATAGQPTLEQLEAVADQGYALVVNLRKYDADDAVADEAGWVSQLGMYYVNIPVDFTAPDLADLTRFLNAMNLHHGDKCFVHSSRGKRATVFVSLYQIIANQMTAEEGWLHVNSIWEPDMVWTKYFNDVINAFASVIRADN